MSKERRLAAIMFTDIVGYSAMMHKDEKGTLEILNRHRSILEERTAAHDGRVIHYYGDGSLSIYSSGIEAVKCAIEMQVAFKSDPKVPLRIGIHLGDIVIGDGDVYGDGVNVASRIETLGVSGCIMVSKRIQEDFVSHPEFQYISMGDFEFKNITQPLEVFAISNEGLAVPDKEKITGKLKEKDVNKEVRKKLIKWLAVPLLSLLAFFVIFQLNNNFPITGVDTNQSFQTIAVLPFKSSVEDPIYSRIGESISDEVRSKLVYVSEIRTMAEYTSQRLDSMDFSQVKNNTGVTHLVRGSIKAERDSIVVLANMVDVNTEVLTGLGSFTFSREELQNIVGTITSAILNELNVSLKVTESSQLSANPTPNQDAFILFHQGKHLLNRYSAEKINESIEYFSKAIQLDSLYADAYAMRAAAYIQSASWHGDNKPEEVLFDFFEDLNKALEINPKLARAYYEKAVAEFFYKWDFESAEKNFKKAYEIKEPGNSLGSLYGFFLFTTGRYEAALEILKKEHALDPVNEQIMVDLSEALYLNGKKEEAFSLLEKGLELNENHVNLNNWLGFLHLLEDNYQESIAAVKIGSRLEPNHIPMELYFEGWFSARRGDRVKVENILEQIDQYESEGLIYRFDPYFLKADYYALLGDKKKALEFLQKSLSERELGLPHLIWWKEKFYTSMKNDPEFIQILRDIGLEAYL